MSTDLQEDGYYEDCLLDMQRRFDPKKQMPSFTSNLAARNWSPEFLVTLQKTGTGLTPELGRVCAQEAERKIREWYVAKILAKYKDPSKARLMTDAQLRWNSATGAAPATKAGMVKAEATTAAPGKAQNATTTSGIPRITI